MLRFLEEEGKDVASKYAFMYHDTLHIPSRVHNYIINSSYRIAQNFGGLVSKIHLVDKALAYWVLCKVFEGV